MAKTRRNKSKQRKTRKQRGGVQYQIKGMRSSGKTFLIDKEEGNTARQVLRRFINMNFPNQNTDWSNTEQPILPYIMKIQGKHHEMNKQENWNNTTLLKNLTNMPTIEFRPVSARLESLKRRKLEAAKESFEIVKKALDYCKLGKIILMSAAATDAIPKNVKQQFMFDNLPPGPILLIDWGFFKSSYDFYHFLNFEENTDIDLGPRDKIRLYEKPEGVPLEAKDSTNLYQQKYLKEVYKQADGKDLTENISIICIKHDLQYEDNEDMSIQQYIHDNGYEFRIYTFEGEEIKPKHNKSGHTNYNSE